MTTIDPAVHSVEALEAVAVGQPWGESHAAAAAALDEAHAAAVGELFPLDVLPAEAGVYEALRFYADGFARGAQFGRAAADLHRRCLTSWPALAALLRDPGFLAVVADLAGNDAARHGREPGEFTAAAIATYQLTIASQLVEDVALGAPARALVEVEALRHRVETCVGRHKEHAAAEVERQRAEARRAEEIRDAEERRRIQVARVEAEAAGQAARRAAEHARLELARVLGDRMGRTKIKSLYLDGGHCSVSALLPKLTEFSVQQLEALREGLDRGEARA